MNQRLLDAVAACLATKSVADIRAARDAINASRQKSENAALAVITGRALLGDVHTIDPNATPLQRERQRRGAQ